MHHMFIRLCMLKVFHLIGLQSILLNAYILNLGLNIYICNYFSGHLVAVQGNCGMKLHCGVSIYIYIYIYIYLY